MLRSARTLAWSLSLSFLAVCLAVGLSVRRGPPSGLILASEDQIAQPVEIETGLHRPFRFVAYGDTRFTDPSNMRAANPDVRRRLVRAIADVRPDFITFGGDIVYNGDIANDWSVYDQETVLWRELGIPVYPALGNHDLHGDVSLSLHNYFARFPVLRESRFYAVHAANAIMLTLDSVLDELTGLQGEWLQSQLGRLSADTDFVIVVIHHPPYTSSSDAKEYGGGHSSRPAEEMLARFFEEVQKGLRARLVVFSGHVHNYERHEHGGVTYFVTGGGGAHAYPITRNPDDLFQSKEVNNHFIVVDVDGMKLKATMRRLDLQNGVESWSQPDSVTITVSERLLTKHPSP